jgi:hypothetical protein
MRLARAFLMLPVAVVLLEASPVAAETPAPANAAEVVAEPSITSEPCGNCKPAEASVCQAAAGEVAIYASCSPTQHPVVVARLAVARQVLHSWARAEDLKRAGVTE